MLSCLEANRLNSPGTLIFTLLIVSLALQLIVKFLKLLVNLTVYNLASCIREIFMDVHSIEKKKRKDVPKYAPELKGLKNGGNGS